LASRRLPQKRRCLVDIASLNRAERRLAGVTRILANSLGRDLDEITEYSDRGVFG